MTIDGRAIAEDIYLELAPKFAALNRTITLGIIVVGENPVIESFVRIKERAATRLGIQMVRKDLPGSASQTDIISAIHNLARDVDGVIAQLPMPKDIDVDAVLSAIPHGKDVDALNPTISDEERDVYAPVALAAVEVLNRSSVEIHGKSAVVVGAGRLVGAPTFVLLRKMGATVSMFTLDEGKIEDLEDADIVVLGAGNPGFIKPEHLKEGVALIDAGASESKGKIKGDADPECAHVASVFTPVPGGIGPIAVAMIFRNLFELLKK